MSRIGKFVFFYCCGTAGFAVLPLVLTLGVLVAVGVGWPSWLPFVLWGIWSVPTGLLLYREEQKS